MRLEHHLVGGYVRYISPHIIIIIIIMSSCNQPTGSFQNCLLLKREFLHDVTANGLYLSFSPCKATNFTYFVVILGFKLYIAWSFSIKRKKRKLLYNKLFTK